MAAPLRSEIDNEFNGQLMTSTHQIMRGKKITRSLLNRQASLVNISLF